MNYLHKLERQLWNYLFVRLLAAQLAVVGAAMAAVIFSPIPPLIIAILAVTAALTTSLLFAGRAMTATTGPTRALWQAIWHVSANKTDEPAPDIDHAPIGRELLQALVPQIYTMASQRPEPTKADQKRLVSAADLIELLPLPLFILDASRSVSALNSAAASLLQATASESIGKNIDNVLPLQLGNNMPLKSWLDSQAGQTATASQSWLKVRLQLPGSESARLFDVAAHYNQGNSYGCETLVLLMERTEAYRQEESSSDYVALAVHELRTPLTVLRGYIEVFEDELGPSLNPEQQQFMDKMGASAKTLTAFVSNILNVARIDQNQFEVSLHEADWNTLITEICADLEIRAKVRGKKIQLSTAPDLPAVAVDKISIYEVLSNLIENAIKYGGTSDTIAVTTSLAKDGTVATEVQDFGIGMPPGAVNNLFRKFYRAHRSRQQASGSGLGLYLVKSIITAHGGNVWVRSQEGQGSTFGFSLQPYAQAAVDHTNKRPDIQRHTHGWIKNHAMSRK